jgi:hypothetical protein
VYVYPHTLHPGAVPLPASEPSVLIVLSRVAATTSGGAASGAAPVARSYDGHPWEGVAASPLPLRFYGDANATAEVTIPTSAAGVTYRLDLFNASSLPLPVDAYPEAMRSASRLLLQATFGPTRGELATRAIGNDSSLDAARGWVHAQFALPPSLVREHWRRRSNPRLDDGYSPPTGRVRPACSVGSRWHRFALTLRDRGKTLTLEATPSRDIRFVVDEETRTEEPAESRANYTTASEGRCIGAFEEIRNLDECAKAALALGLPWDREYPAAKDDGRDGGTAGPTGCYLEGNPHPGSYRSLYVNVANSNTGKCQPWDLCICKRVELSTYAPPPQPPSLPAPPSPPAPPASPGYSDPSQCPSGQCCTVIFKGVAGAQCNPVPIWDFSSWTHPGGDIFTKSRLCGNVRYSWLGYSNSHGTCDSASFCDPEADVNTLDGFTDAGDATRVGTYLDPACVSSSQANASSTVTRLDAYVCEVSEKVGGRIKLVPLATYNAYLAQGKQPCTANGANNLKDFFTLPNPAIELPSPDPVITQAGFTTSDAPLVEINARGAPDAYTLSATPPGCRLSAKPSSYLQVGGKWYRHDRRIEFMQNTVEHPDAGINATRDEIDGMSGTCPAVVKTFVNEAGCVKRQTCGPVRFTSARFQLNETTLRMFYTLSSALAYQVRGLALAGPYAVSPCDAGISRWMRTVGTCGAGVETQLDNETRLSIETALSVTTSDTNEYMRDIDIQADGNGTCTSSLNGVSAMGASLTINGSCWTHVHPHEGNVYFFSYWAIAHNGNDNFKGPLNPIKKWARSGQTTIQLPGSHKPLMKDRWQSTVDKKYIWEMGRFGDTVDFKDLPLAAQQMEVATALGADGTGPNVQDSSEACGSPGEVANDPMLGHRYRTYLTADEKDSEELLFPHNAFNAKSMAWTTVVLGASDQLRHRVAFALSQILVIGVEGLGKEDEVELWLGYYDIFVRHAFGNYRSILKEVSFSPMMSHYLTYHNNRAFAYAKTHPDENYAREIMQLFSIGLWQLGPDGQRVLDGSGEPIATYDNGVSRVGSPS